VRFLRAVAAPLVRRSTYRRLTFLLLGSAAGFGVSVAGTMLLILWLPGGESTWAAIAGILGPVIVPMPLVVVIGMLRSTLIIQRTLARVLLGVSAAELPAEVAGSWRHRWRSGVFFALHVVAGYFTGVLVIVIVTFAGMTVAAYAEPTALGVSGDPGDPTGVDTTNDMRRLGPLGMAGGLLVLPYLAAVLGAAFARLARRLLGPTADEKLAALQHRVRNLAEHNRLARELHDSVGHALSVVAVQAGAAQRILDRDPLVARAALTAISDSARRALADLDHVLALLREEPATTRPQWTLDNIDQLVSDVRAAGLRVEVHRMGDFSALPAVVSREAYRIVQEGLTNALRHAGPVPVMLLLRNDGERLEVEMSNPLPQAGVVPLAAILVEKPPEAVGAAPPTADAAQGLADEAVGWPESGGRRGLTGIRERVALLGGELAAGPAGERWQVSVRVPLGSPAAAG